MPKGIYVRKPRIPKQYPQPMVDQVRRLYDSGMTQGEVAKRIGVSQKIIWKLMVNHGINARVAAKRFQRGSDNHMWKGDRATYAALHLRVQAIRGTPSMYKHCGTSTAKRFEWASLNKRYEDPFDYVRLCSSCHHIMDGHVANLGDYAVRKEVRSA